MLQFSNCQQSLDEIHLITLWNNTCYCLWVTGFQWLHTSPHTYTGKNNSKIWHCVCVYSSSCSVVSSLSSSSSSLTSSSSLSSSSSSSSSALASSSAFLRSSSSCSSFIFFSASLVTAHRSSPAFLASSGSSVIIRLSKIVPDLPCHRSKPSLHTSSNLPMVLASSASYSGFSISGWTQ